MEGATKVNLMQNMEERTELIDTSEKLKGETLVRYSANWILMATARNTRRMKYKGSGESKRDGTRLRVLEE